MTKKWKTDLFFYGLPRNFFKIPRNDGNSNDTGLPRQQVASERRQRQRQKATAKTKRMKSNQDAVTANPLGCGSLWNNKQQQRQRQRQRQTAKTALDCHDLRSRNDKKKWKTDLFCYGLPRQQVATE